MFSDCMFVALGIQREMCMRHIVIFGLSGYTMFFHFISYISKTVTEHKMCVLIFSTTFV